MNDDNLNLTPEQIGLLLDGEADEALKRLVAENPALQAELDEIRRFDAGFGGMLHHDEDYPSSIVIGEYVLGTLDDEARHNFEKLLVKSPRLQEDVNETRAFLEQEVNVPSVSEIESDSKTILWAQPVLTAEEEKLKVAGEQDNNKAFTFESGDHSLLLEIQVDYEHNTRLIGQFITSEPEEWADAHVKVHFRNGDALKFHLDELNTFDEAWPHPREFVLHIINASGDVFHTGLISI